jgi:hypothetical protein
MTRDSYAEAIESFLGELAAIVGGITDEQLAGMPDFLAELNESIVSLRDPRRTPIEIVRLALGIVDELVHARREQIMNEAYEFYIARNP